MAKNIMKGHVAAPKNGSPKIKVSKLRNASEVTTGHSHSSGNNAKQNRSSVGRG